MTFKIYDKSHEHVDHLNLWATAERHLRGNLFDYGKRKAIFILIPLFEYTMHKWGVKEMLFFFFFFMEIHIYTLNIKTTVTWHNDFYGCQGYKKKKSNN